MFKNTANIPCSISWSSLSKTVYSTHWASSVVDKTGVVRRWADAMIWLLVYNSILFKLRVAWGGYCPQERPSLWWGGCLAAILKWFAHFKVTSTWMTGSKVFWHNSTLLFTPPVVLMLWLISGISISDIHHVKFLIYADCCLHCNSFLEKYLAMKMCKINSVSQVSANICCRNP